MRSPLEQQGSKWSELWDQKTFLPWDAGTPNPALEDVLAEQAALLGLGQPAGKRALVPVRTRAPAPPGVC